MPRLALLFFSLAAAAQDLRLHYTSAIDNTQQPYRLYIPPNHANPAPLVIAMHGTGGNENPLFDQHPTLKQAADNHGILVVSPNGRGVAEYRGTGENDVLTVLDEVRKKYAIDPARIYLTGHSMQCPQYIGKEYHACQPNAYVSQRGGSPARNTISPSRDSITNRGALPNWLLS